MRKLSPGFQDIPLKMVGGTKFGRYQKISVEQTFNMIQSDDWMVPYAGYLYRINLTESGFGRGLYTSTKENKMYGIAGNQVFMINQNINKTNIANISSSEGDVFISENNGSQIAFCDKKDIYIYNYQDGSFAKATIDGTNPLDFTPAFIDYQDGYFIAPDSNSFQWRVSAPNNGLLWPSGPNNTGELETKADRAVAAVRFPGKGNLLYLFGNTVTESWIDTGIQLFPYEKNTYTNIDYGCLNQATIASNDIIVIWLGFNNKSGPVIMYSDGSQANQISNDGINFKLAQLKNPANSYGFMFKQDGHIIYQITFPDPRDNVSYAYDFNTSQFFTVTDEYLNYHIAKRVVSFNNSYYFVSFNDGNLYEFNSQFTNFTYNDPFLGIIQKEIPRIRITPPIRLPDQSRIAINNLTFPIEQGQGMNAQRIDLSLSKDGGETFSSFGSKIMNQQGRRENRCNFWRLGSANDLSCMFRFNGLDRVTFTDGIARIYQ